jgi:hypothetical protein
MNILYRLIALARSLVQSASAHCDTEDGPVVAAGRQALGTGNVNHALPWVRAADEPEVLDAFGAVLVADAADRAAAERAFLETLVRVHRAGEGEQYDGIKPAGTPQPPAVSAADEALAAGDLAVLAPLVDEDYLGEVARRFAAAGALRRHDVDDVAAGRAYVGAYVEYVHHAARHAAGAGHAH